MLRLEQFINLIRYSAKHTNAVDQANIETFIPMNKAAVNAKDQDGYPILQLAVTQGYTVVVEQLLAIDELDVNATDAAGNTALHWAVFNNEEKIFHELLKHKKTNVKALNQKQQSVLHMGLSAYPIKESLVASLINLNLGSEADKDGYTPLMHAVTRGNEHAIKLLMDVDSTDVYAVANDGYTAISYAHHMGDNKARNVVINSKKINRQALFVGAAGGGHLDTVKSFLKAPDIDVNACDPSGHNALVYAIKLNVAYLRYILSALLADDRVDPNVKDKHGNTALMMAVSKRNEIAVSALLAHREFISVDVTDKDGETPLSRAVLNFAAYYKAYQGYSNSYAYGDSTFLIVARLLLKTKNELTEKSLLALKEHKKQLFDKLKTNEPELDVLREIFDNPQSVLHQVFFYKNATIKKGRLGELYTRYLELSKNASVDVEPGVVNDNAAADNEASLIEKYINTLAFNDLLKVLLVCHQSKVTASVLAQLKLCKQRLYTNIKKLPRADFLKVVKDIIEGKEGTTLGKIFWHGDTRLTRGRLAEVYSDYKIMVTAELVRMIPNELQAHDIKLIKEFVNGGASFELDDKIFFGVIWKWVKQADINDVTPAGIEYLKQHKAQFDQLKSLRKETSTLLDQILPQKAESSWFASFFQGKPTQDPKNVVTLGKDGVSTDIASGLHSTL